MKLPAPRIIVIDDDQKHLEGLAQGLNRLGTSCLPVHFTGELTIEPCSHVRVIFADLHLSSGTPGDHAKNFAMIGGLIEESIRPSGPYFIVLWTMYPNEAPALHKYLAEGLQGVVKPFTVHPLDKSKHLDAQGEVKNPEELVQTISRIVAQEPQIGALFNWEERVLDAAAETLSSITAMAASAANDETTGQGTGRILRNLAIGAVGVKHVKEDRFRAVNDALLPILADHIASLRSRQPDDELWQQAISGADAELDLSIDEAAKLNRFLHIAPSNPNDDGRKRGIVLPLPEEFSGEAFEDVFGLTAEKAKERQFLCKKPDDSGDQSCWVLIQTQASCDYAQKQPGSLPFHLGLCLPDFQVGRDKPPAALWCSPVFEYENSIRALHVSARFQVSLSKAMARQATPLFRLREQLLNVLIYQIHDYGARPGAMLFR